MSEYIYLIQDNRFSNNFESIYKICKNKYLIDEPIDSKLLLYTECNNCDEKFDSISILFKQHFIHMKEIGNDYYKGDLNIMIDIFQYI